jgi:hypothetical protein
MCKAVGNNGVIRSWTSGTNWTGDTSGTGNILYGIACPTATRCKAVGASGTILTWNATSWTADTSGTFNNLHAISCPTSTFCMAVGQSGVTVAWNGSSWTSHSSGTALNLNGVSCPTTTRCKAVGVGGTILTWDGSAWSADVTHTTQTLNGVGCPTVSMCKAAGLNGTILGMVQQTLTDVSAGFALDIFNDTGCLVELSATEFNANHPNATEPLETGRYWTLSSGTCASGFTGSLTIPVLFTPGEDDKVCRYPGSGTNWDCAANGFSATTLTRTGISAFSDWTGGIDAGPSAVELARFTARVRMPSVGWVGGMGLLSGLSWWVFYRKQRQEKG